MPQLAIIADDLTGAADAGASFAAAGLATVIPLSNAAVPDADVVVLSTESRDLETDAAIEVVRAAVAGLMDGADAPRWIYKKIDSALRGHPRDELLAVMEAVGERRALVAPALPSHGRTTVGGRQFVSGKPLEATWVAGPGALSDLRALFAVDGDVPVRMLSLDVVRGDVARLQDWLDGQPEGIIVADAESDEDLRVLATAAPMSGARVLSGSAGLARQLVRTLPFVPSGKVLPEQRAERGSVLVVAGSQHPRTVRQVRALERAGVPFVCLSQEVVDDAAASMAATVDEVAACLRQGQSVVLTTAGLATSPLGQRHVVARLAEVASAPAVCGQLGGMVLTGGDVAAGVCGRLGATALWLRGEVIAAVPWGVLEGGMLAGTPVVTKAGSFGEEDALLACIRYLGDKIARTGP